MPETPDRPQKPYDPARTQFIGLALFRLSGALIAAFGLAIYAERIGAITGDKAHQLGSIVIIVGLLQFAIVPRMLARAFRTPPQNDSEP